MTTEEQKAQIDLNVTDKTSVNSITPANVGGEMKSLVDYIDAVILKTRITLTPEQINNLGTTPVEAIPNPGEGKLISVISAVAHLTFNTTPYTGHGINIRHSTAGSSYFSFSGFISSTETTTAVSIITTATKIVANDSVVIRGTNSVVVGDSNIDFFISYQIITL